MMRSKKLRLLAYIKKNNDGTSEVAKNLRQKLGKREGEDYTMEDCEKVANAIADMVSEEFSENLLNAIEYEM